MQAQQVASVLDGWEVACRQQEKEVSMRAEARACARSGLSTHSGAAFETGQLGRRNGAAPEGTERCARCTSKRAAPSRAPPHAPCSGSLPTAGLATEGQPMP